MILYVNGDSHTAGAEAVNSHAFADDDPAYKHLGRLPHPDNLEVSWGTQLANLLKTGFHCDAESAASNSRIIRTTKEYTSKINKPDNFFFIIQLSTWEREEWLIDGNYYQVNASGIDIVPDNHKQRYKEYIANIDWDKKTKQAHDDVIELHEFLEGHNLRHIFFNGNNTFSRIKKKYNFGTSYMQPYTKNFSFSDFLLNQNIQTVLPGSYHFGKDGHSKWANVMLKYIIKNNLF